MDARGLASGARFIPSPNCDDRPPGEAVRLIVIHNISLPPGEFGGDDIARLFCNTLDCSAHPYYDGLRDLRVSAHFLVRRWGEIVQFVQCTRRAWHAGESTWRGRTCCNDFSIGIELEGADAVPYADAQYAALAALTAALMRAYPVEEVLGHADIAPGRKTDPGSAFDWPRFRTLLSRAA
ncbi:MAG TPA: 1,6-anhydro-N-acetylmuramyl-L-alanine amidase AmpD [Burkholderiales bacterium]|nr:1,6-anhydro-N-acetylmuramyl-L-alanine amidase AmpD [Burkholderiales bacterium]